MSNGSSLYYNSLANGSPQFGEDWLRFSQVPQQQVSQVGQLLANPNVQQNIPQYNGSWRPSYNTQPLSLQSQPVQSSIPSAQQAETSAMTGGQPGATTGTPTNQTQRYGLVNPKLMGEANLWGSVLGVGKIFSPQAMLAVTIGNAAYDTYKNWDKYSAQIDDAWNNISNKVSGWFGNNQSTNIGMNTAPASEGFTSQPVTSSGSSSGSGAGYGASFSGNTDTGDSTSGWGSGSIGTFSGSRGYGWGGGASSDGSDGGSDGGSSD